MPKCGVSRGLERQAAPPAFDGRHASRPTVSSPAGFFPGSRHKGEFCEGQIVKTALDHLPERRRKEVQYVRDVILTELERKIAASRSARAKNYRILKLILYGSFARGTWFDDRKSGRASDYDLLAIVSHKQLTNMAGFWNDIEDWMIDDPGIGKEVSLIVHTLTEVNKELKDGQYFFCEIVNQGILLYEVLEKQADGRLKHKLRKPAAPDPRRAFEMAKAYNADWKQRAKRRLSIGRDNTEKRWLNEAAFDLHQAAEAAYRMILLTMTLYAPGTHSLRTLRRMSEKIDDRLKAAWPRDRKPFKRYFELLRRAYVEARYSTAYETTQEALHWQAERITDLIELGDVSCRERLIQLEAAAKEAP